MDLHFLDGSAPELKSWLTDRGGYLFEERPEAVHRATIGLRAAYGEDGTMASGPGTDLTTAFATDALSEAAYFEAIASMHVLDRCGDAFSFTGACTRR